MNDRLKSGVMIVSEDAIKSEEDVLGLNKIYHYDCLMKSFKGARNTNCPYCRSLNNLLPLVNGIKKVEYNIHDTSNINDYQNVMCKTLLKTGKNKGNECGKYCKLGYFTCSRDTK